MEELLLQLAYLTPNTVDWNTDDPQPVSPYRTLLGYVILFAIMYTASMIFCKSKEEDK